MDGKVPLFVIDEANDPLQLHLKDIVGTTTLWDREYFISSRRSLTIHHRPYNFVASRSCVFIFFLPLYY